MPQPLTSTRQSRRRKLSSDGARVGRSITLRTTSEGLLPFNNSFSDYQYQLMLTSIAWNLQLSTQAPHRRHFLGRSYMGFPLPPIAPAGKRQRSGRIRALSIDE